MMQGALPEDMDLKDELIEIKEEEEGATLVEILEPFGPTFLCTICGKTHSKTISCVDYGVFKTDEFLCSNQNCGKNFESKTELEQHGDSCQITAPLFVDMATLEDEDLYLLRPDLKQCKDCQETFDTELLYLLHMKIVHPELINCIFLGCNKFFRTQRDFGEHLMKNHKKLATCGAVNKPSSTSTVWLHPLNQKLQQNKTNLKFKSTIAKSDFVTEVDVQKLKLQAPNSFKKCIFCDKVFDKNYLYIDHIYGAHQGWKLFKCSMRGCVKYFKSHVEMEKHFKETHPQQEESNLALRKEENNPAEGKQIDNAPKNVTSPQITPNDLIDNCTFCLNHFPLQEMNEHRNAFCKKCKKSIPCQGLLEIHKVKCVIQRAVPNKRLKVNSMVQNNQAWKGLKYKALGVKCDACRRYYCNGWALKKHNQQKHQTVIRLSCDLCKKTYASKFSMYQHFNMMHKFGDEKLKCDKCRKTFFKGYLDRHVKQVHGEKIECKDCGKTFKRSYFYTNHSKHCVPKALV